MSKQADTFHHIDLKNTEEVTKTLLINIDNQLTNLTNLIMLLNGDPVIVYEDHIQKIKQTRVAVALGEKSKSTEQ